MSTNPIRILLRKRSHILTGELGKAKASVWCDNPTTKRLPS
ncbi:hypothetical protein EVA_02481 [gut metagenome]|uniref:Uncharacterized protein n=1 Tax=gut metagenome TaxID=749906 RepID=J9H109_9ZZZZ